jgi:hypothetical protein
VKDFIADLGWRADHIDTEHLEYDNVLKISNDGRNVSLDPRLAHLAAPRRSRASAVADEIMRIHTATADTVYLDPDTGRDMPIRGGLQIVFCDRGTPSADRNSSPSTRPSATNWRPAVCRPPRCGSSTTPQNPPTSCVCCTSVCTGKSVCSSPAPKRAAPE